MFRYQLICPALDKDLSTKARGRLVREIAAKEHVDPVRDVGALFARQLGPVDPALAGQGVVELIPSTRAMSPRTHVATLELAAALHREKPARTAAQMARIMLATPGWSPGGDVATAISPVGVIGPAAGDTQAVFGRFEAENPNERWTGDGLHGPGSRVAQGDLFAFLDDHSRLMG